MLEILKLKEDVASAWMLAPLRNIQKNYDRENMDCFGSCWNFWPKVDSRRPRRQLLSVYAFWMSFSHPVQTFIRL
ncbi:hypothetical protein SLEP1_g23755 [Rubroshorea leprosula]|uniref:Uncharacterized protein n=1 Tax=Rubroshorea leprosula TaxID=152421 RepID=A0AAV5JMP3_9ROSI|nr:hypothetical protein SLEP1_g23755 [Rubroshorea leprosula]